MTIKEYMSGVLAVLFSNDEEKLSKIDFMKDISTYERNYNADTLASESIKLGRNQKVTLFGYIYLYCKLSNSYNNFEQILKCSDLPTNVVESYESVITQNRIDYIKKNYDERKADFIELFNESEDYISELITSAVMLPVKEPKKRLNNLEACFYEHAEDRAALNKLNGNKALENVIKLYSKYRIEKLITINYTGSNIKVTKDNIPYLHNALIEACEVLDIAEIPELYIEQGFVNAVTIGSDKPIVVISNACLSMLTHDELMFIIGHELGHIKSQHILYHTIGNFLPGIAEYIGNFTLGVGNLISSGLSLVLENWHRKSEFTADRAGLLVCQNFESVVSTMCKLAGFPPKFYNKIDVEDFLDQAQSFCDMDKNSIDKAIKYISAASSTHPWTVMRAYELDKWVKSGGYDRVLERYSEENMQSLNSKRCFNCGNEYEENVNFCRKCGYRL